MPKVAGEIELAAFVECSTGSTPTVAALKRFAGIISSFGYKQLYLGLTDGYKIEGEPYFNFCRGGYTTEQLREIDGYCASLGLELRANIQTLAHLGYVGRHDCYRDIMDTDDILLVGEEKTYAFIEKMLSAVSRGIKSRVIHIGLDEAFRVGQGRYFELHGFRERRDLILEHLRRVREIAKKFGYRIEIWSDMFYRMIRGSDYSDKGEIPLDVKGAIPEGVTLMHWKYHKQPPEILRTQLRQLKSVCGDVAFAGCAWKSLGLAPVNYYGVDTVAGQLDVCREEGIGRFVVTMWSDAGAHCSIFSVLPTLFAAAELAHGVPKNAIDKTRFERLTEAEYDEVMLLDNLNNPFFKDLPAFGGRSYWGLYSDLLLGSYDLLISPGTDAAYSRLSERYSALADKYSGEPLWRDLFRCFRLYAKVLSYKMELGPRLRAAYRSGDKPALREIATATIPTMSDALREFTAAFEERWLTENMPFGLEVHHLYYGGLLTRWEYVAGRLLSHCETGEPIGELEREELPPSLIPERTEDNCLELNPHKLVSYCGF